MISLLNSMYKKESFPNIYKPIICYYCQIFKMETRIEFNCHHKHCFKNIFVFYEYVFDNGFSENKAAECQGE